MMLAKPSLWSARVVPANHWLRTPDADSVAMLANAHAAVCRAMSTPEPTIQYYKDHGRRLALDLAWLRAESTTGSRVLEIGADPFLLSVTLGRAGVDLQCVDILSGAAAQTAKALAVVVTKCDIERDALPFADEVFDEVLVNEVFEHLRLDLIFTFNQVLRVLKRGGRIWLSTPNLRSLRGIWNFVVRSEGWSCMGEGLYAQYRSLSSRGHMGHVREYTAREVADFLYQVGFRDLEIRYRGTFTNVAARCLSRVFPSFLPFFSIVARRSRT